MHSVLKTSSYPQSETSNIQISQMWRKDQYRGKSIRVFLNFTSFKFYTYFFRLSDATTIQNICKDAGEIHIQEKGLKTDLQFK